MEPDVANDTTTNMWFSMPVFDDILKDVLDPSMPGKEEVIWLCKAEIMVTGTRQQETKSAKYP